LESAHYNGGAIYGLSKGEYPLNNSNFGLMEYSINGNILHLSGGLTGAISTNFASPFPFWIPSGSSLAASTNVSYLSVIEFNIVP
jgi:hypothetical protein